MKQLGNLCYEREVMSKARCAWTGRCCECLVSKSCLTLCDPWTVALQAPLSMEFSRQKYWSGLPFLSLGDLPDPGIEPMSPAVQMDS